jgi:hypothetical protein
LPTTLRNRRTPPEYLALHYAAAGVLAKYAQAYARANEIAEGRVRAWISYMITAGVLQRAAAVGQPPFIVKGGVALELRLCNRARGESRKTDIEWLRLGEPPARQVDDAPARRRREPSAVSATRRNHVTLVTPTFNAPGVKLSREQRGKYRAADRP